MIVKVPVSQSATPKYIKREGANYRLNPCASASVMIYFPSLLFCYLKFVSSVFITLPSLYLYHGSNVFHKALFWDSIYKIFTLFAKIFLIFIIYCFVL